MQYKGKVPHNGTFFIGLFTAKSFIRAEKKRASDGHRRPVLTSETTKRKRLKNALSVFTLRCTIKTAYPSIPIVTQKLLSTNRHERSA
jgi:hypothetical protein